MDGSGLRRGSLFVGVCGPPTVARNLLQFIIPAKQNISAVRAAPFISLVSWPLTDVYGRRHGENTRDWVRR